MFKQINSIYTKQADFSHSYSAKKTMPSPLPAAGLLVSFFSLQEDTIQFPSPSHPLCHFPRNNEELFLRYELCLQGWARKSSKIPRPPEQNGTQDTYKRYSHCFSLKLSSSHNHHKPGYHRGGL